MLAHPPIPNPMTSTHPTIKMFTRNIAFQLGRKNGGFSEAFCEDHQDEEENNET